MQKVYCDTCIYIDALDLSPSGSKDRYRDLSQFAWHFLTKVDEGVYRLVTSPHIFNEFKKVVGTDAKLKELLDKIDNKEFVDLTEEDKIEARKLSSDNFPDALHVVLAKKAGAFILTTRDIKHFYEFKDIIEIWLPESL